MAMRKQTNTQHCLDGHKHAIVDEDDGAGHADPTRKKIRLATDHSTANLQSGDFRGSHEVIEEPTPSPLRQFSEQHLTSFSYVPFRGASSTFTHLTSSSLDQSQSITHDDYEHECLVEDDSPDATFAAIECWDQDPQTREEKFHCSQAPCQVCLTLGWKYFPEYKKKLREQIESRRFIETKLGKLKMSTNCQYCQLIFGAAEQRGNMGDATKVTIYLRPKFTLQLVIDEYSDLACHLELYTETSKPLRVTRSIVIGQVPHIALRPTVEYCVKFINTQLADCCSSHNSYCNRFAEQELPTRVIDVGTKDTAPKLLESRGRRAKYVTLSHCWGNGEYTPLRTTEASLSGHYNEIPWTKLGQTFQDAILITRELGIQFIWIDSLCIIQDSPSDWETESARMAEIYLHSHLTLSATASTDGRGGCLCSRERDDDVERENYDAALSTGEKLQHIPVNLTKTDIFVRKAAQHAHGIMRQVCENSQESAPLLSRAWVYQETVLSPRTVHFHGEELVWECREALRCECGYYESIDHRQVLLPFGWKHPYTKILFKEKFGQLDVFWVLEQWDSIVWTYSGLRLTYDSDRLHALAGLASFFAEKLEDSYVAGLWYKDLCNGLLWQRDRSVKCRRLLEPGLTMPTWSWASIIPRDHPGAMLDRVSLRRKPLPEADARFAIIEAKCTPQSDRNPFGQVSDGILRLEGALAEVSFVIDPTEPQTYYLRFEHQPYNYPLRTGDRHELVFDVDVGGASEEICPGELFPDELFYCLLVSQTTQRGSTTKHCLVLKKVRESAYIRIGIFNQRENGVDWSRNVKTRQIQII